MTSSKKRINPKTGEFFKRGDVREDGYIFKCYVSGRIKRNGFVSEHWHSPEAFKRYQEKGLKRVKIYWTTTKGRSFLLYNSAKKRSKKFKLPLNITPEWIEEKLIRGVCELTNLKFDFISSKTSFINPYSPSLDRIDSSKGYTKDNTRLVLSSVNSAIGEYGDEKILPILKAIVNAIENAKKKSITPVPAGSYIPGAVGNELGSVSTPWTWEDGDDTHHHCGADARQDSDRSTEASSGDSMGRGDK